MKKNVLVLLMVLSLVLCSSLALAVDWSPQGDVNLKNRYDIINWNITTCGADEVVVGILANGSWNCSAAATGDIKGINTDGTYLEGGCASGTCNITINQSNLNTTISALDTDTNTWWSLITTYLYNNSGSLDVNETKLNATIDARDADTTYTNGTGINLTGTTFSVVLSYFQGLFWELTDVTGYIYNNSGSLDINETMLNATISALDTDTTIGNCSADQSCPNVLYDTNASTFMDNTDSQTLSFSGDNITISGGNEIDISGIDTDTDTWWSIISTYLFNNSGSLDINETKLNATISALDTDTTIGNCSSDQSCSNILYDSNASTFMDNTDSQTLSFSGDNITISGGNEIDISGIDTDTNTWWSIISTYLYNNSGSLDVNETKLNATIDARADVDTNTWWSIVTTYLYNNSGSLDINETKLNATISALDTDTNTQIGNCSADQSCINILYDSNASDFVAPGDCGVGEYVVNITSAGVECATPSGSGDITAVNTAGAYLTGGADSGAISLLLNETKLNATISALDTDTNTQIGNCSSDQSCSNILYDSNASTFMDNTDAQTLSFSGDNITISGGNEIDISGIDTDTDTWWDIITTYLYNNSGSLDINETKLNATISALDTDTTIGNCSVTDSCVDILYETELNNISDLNTQIVDATILISGGTLTNAKWCVYDGTGIDCNVEPVSDTDTQDISYNTATNVISLVDGGTINISEVDTDTNTQIGNCSADQSCTTILYDTNASDFAPVAIIGDCGAGEFVQNVTSTGTECRADVDTNTQIGNCSADQSCSTILYDTNASDFRAQSWNNLSGIPHATPADADVTHFSLSDEIYDWVIGLSYWASGSDVGANEIAEASVNMTTVCGAGSHLYVSGGNFACESDDYNSAFDTEDEIEAVIFDDDNAANFNISGYNISAVDCIHFDSGGMICSG